MLCVQVVATEEWVTVGGVSFVNLQGIRHIFTTSVDARKYASQPDSTHEYVGGAAI